MKKIALILSLVLMLAACGAAPAETTTPAAAGATAPEGTCAELVEKLYENVPVELMLATETMETSLSDAEMFTWLTGLESNEGVTDVAVSQPMMGAQAYHVVMVRAESNEKAAELSVLSVIGIAEKVGKRSLHCGIFVSVEINSQKQKSSCGKNVSYPDMLD